MKITFYGKEYFSYGWNIFDFGALCGIITFQVLFLFVNLEHNPVTVLLTLFRVGKLLSLFRVLKALRRMFQTTILALPSAVNIALLVIFVNYIFAVIGVALFAETKLQKDLDDHANFKDLLTGFLTAFRIASGDNWCVLMHDLMRVKTQYFDCLASPTYSDIYANNNETNGCGRVDAAVYCILLVLIVNFIFLNLFVAIVVASMLEISELSESVLSDEILDKFQRTWSKYDPDALGMLEYSNLWNFLCDLGKPLGVCKDEMPNRYYSAITLWMLELKIYYYNVKSVYCVEFYDVLEALVKKTIYRPQTLNKIFHNKSKDDLVEGLQELWAEKSKLLIDDQESLGKIEALSHYYNAKKTREKQGMCHLKKAQLPLLVWLTLRITRTLRLMVRKREGESLGSSDEEEGSDIIESQISPQREFNASAVSPLTALVKAIRVECKNETNKRPRRQTMVFKQPSKSRICFGGGARRENTIIGNKATVRASLKTPLEIYQMPLEREEHKMCKRVVENKKPHVMPKVNIKKCTEQLKVQNILHTLGQVNKPPPRILCKEESVEAISQRAITQENDQQKSEIKLSVRSPKLDTKESRLDNHEDKSDDKSMSSRRLIASPRQKPIKVVFGRGTSNEYPKETKKGLFHLSKMASGYDN